MITIGKASATPTVWRMWRRLRRRTMAPSRPVVYPEQVGLILLSVLAIAAGVSIVVRVLIGAGRHRGARQEAALETAETRLERASRAPETRSWSGVRDLSA